MRMRVSRLNVAIFLVLSAILFIPGLLMSQHTSLTSLYKFNKYDLISAYAGLEGSVFATANYRSQWRSLDAQPAAQRANVHLPLYFLQGAAGMKIGNHSQGHQDITNLELSYNYVIDRSWGLLSASVHLGFFQFRLNGRALRTPGGNYTDNNFSHNDPRIGEDFDSSIGGRYGLSVYYINDYFEGGLSLSQFPSYQTRLEEGGFRYGNILKIFAEVPIYLLDAYKITPSVLIQSDFVQTQTDISAVVEYSGNIFGGLGVRGYSSRSLDAVILICGWRFDQNYSLSYAFDFGVSALRSVHEGTHEIQLNYNLNRRIGAGLPPKVIYNPRYM